MATNNNNNNYNNNNNNCNNNNCDISVISNNNNDNVNIKNGSIKTNHSFCRIWVALLGISACILLCSARYNISIAIISMTEDACTTNTSHCANIDQNKQHEHWKHLSSDCKSESNETSRKPLNWDEEQQGLIIGAYYIGFAATNVFGGRWAERYGPKWIVAIGLISAAIINSLLPFITRFDYRFFALFRILIGCFHGIVHPALFFMFKNWFPHHEQTVALSMLLIGNALGLIIIIPISAFIIRIHYLNWSLLFYGISVLHLIWIIFWIYLVTNIPEKHKFIKDNEISYIRQNSNNVLENNLFVVPWKRILKTKALYGSIMAKICWSFNHSIIIDNGPLYMNRIFGYNMLDSSKYLALIYLATVLVFLFSPKLFTIMNRQLTCTITRLRKIFQYFVFFGASITMFFLANVDCNLNMLILLIVFNMITQGFISVGEYPIINEFAGYYSGTVYGIAITFDSLACFIAPVIRGELVEKSNTLANWNLMFYINAALNLIGLLVFEYCASASLRKWAIKKDLVRQISSYTGHLEPPVKKELKIELQNPHFRQDINTETDEWIEFKSSTLVQ